MTTVRRLARHRWMGGFVAGLVIAGIFAGEVIAARVLDLANLAGEMES